MQMFGICIGLLADDVLADADQRDMYAFSFCYFLLLMRDRIEMDSMRQRYAIAS